MKLALFLFSVWSFAALAEEKKVFILGGSDPGEVGNAFKNSCLTFKTHLESLGWASEVYFGKGDLDIPGSNAATAKNMAKLQNSLANVKSGQVLIFVQAHGSMRHATLEQSDRGQVKRKHPRNTKDGLAGDPVAELTHSIGLEDGYLYSLDSLIIPITTLVHRGVHVALVDTSCYSGNSQALQVPGLCTVSMAPNTYVSAITEDINHSFFDQVFVDVSPTGPTLSIEEQFLKARLFDRTNYPQISSFETPDLKFTDYFNMVYDPRGHGRAQWLTQPGGSCLHCATEDYGPSTLERFDEWTTGAHLWPEESHEKLQAIRDNEKRILAAYFRTYQEVSKVALQINPPRAPHVLTGYEGFSREDLIKRYNQLDALLFEYAVNLREQDGFIYQELYAGRSGRINRKNDYCAMFTLR